LGVRVYPALLVGFAALASACVTDAQAPRPGRPTDVVATVGSTTISLEQVDERALVRSASDFGGARLSQVLYEARRDAIDEIASNWLLDQEAKARAIDRSALIENEITAKVAVPSEDDIKNWYEANPARVQGAPLEQIRGAILAFLTQERTLAARDQFINVLKAKTPVRILLEPPRTKIAAEGRPSRGPANASVEIIEFSDFQCPYCLRAYPIVKQVLNTYGNRVRLVYRHYPLPNHPDARPAAEAAACAAEQGKFWEYHDRLFEHQAKLGNAELKQYATDVGLESRQFIECLEARKYQKDVDADLAAGRDAGISGTPGFFINGRPLDGAQPFEAFKTIIDEELNR
jgi:protein-disulfide isomerase